MIKNFIYLDEQKLYSFSSQLFEGITDYVLNEELLDKSSEKSSKDGTPITSSQIIANVIRETSKSTEKKFLHDHSFNLLERELMESDKLIDCSSQLVTIDWLSQELQGRSFIKIKTKAKFIDTRHLYNVFKDFRTLGESFATVDLCDDMIAEEAKIIDATRDKAKKAKLLKEYETNLKLAVAHSMFKSNSYLPEKFIEAFTHLVNFGYEGNLYFYQAQDEVLFTSLLQRDFLRGNITDLVHKYGRATEREFTMLGLVSHGFESVQGNPLENEDIDPSRGFRPRIANLSEHMIILEQGISGKEKNELLIEPIAIYTEL